MMALEERGAETNRMAAISAVVHTVSVSREGKVRLERVLVLRTAANYTLPPAGATAAQLLAEEASEDDVLSAYIPSLEAAYKVASVAVNELAAHWQTYRDHTPGAGP